MHPLYVSIPLAAFRWLAGYLSLARWLPFDGALGGASLNSHYYNNF